MEKIAVSSGVWRIEQNTETKEVVLFKWETEKKRWPEDRLLTWEELYEELLRESYEMRGEQ